MDIIKKFIQDNGLEFDDSGSSLNGNCTIISGFALFKEIDTFSELMELMPKIDYESEKELSTVFEYARRNNYGSWWENENNRNQYKL